MRGEHRGRVIAGAVLIALGLVLFTLQFLGGLGQAILIFVVGVIFLIGYLATRLYGLLVPACILLGIGAGQLVSGAGVFVFDGLTLLALGLGFIAIFVIDLLVAGARRWWPLIPGSILVVIALAQGNETLQLLLARGWPLVLVFIGLIILAGAIGFAGQRNR